jgi:hypothetical protein
MTIHRFLQNVPLGPEEIGGLVAAYEATLKVLGLSNRSDPMTELVAKKILELSQTGICDPEQLSQLTVRAFGNDG